MLILFRFCIFILACLPSHMAIAAESGAPEVIFAPSPIIVAEQDCVAHFQARHHSTMPPDRQQRLEHMMLFNRFFFGFERSLQNLTCRQFRYRVGVVIVEGYVIMPRLLPNTLLPVLNSIARTNWFSIPVLAMILGNTMSNP